MKKIKFSDHALEQMQERGASRLEVEESVRKGEQSPAKYGRTAFRYNFQFNAIWAGKKSAIKQVMSIVVEENNEYIVVTVYTFCF